eukprot:g1743.t1
MVGLWLGSSSTAGYNSFGPPQHDVDNDNPPRDPSCRDTDSVADCTWGSGESGGSGDYSVRCATAGEGDGGSGAESSVVDRRGGRGRGRMTAATGGLLVWASVASLAAVWLAAGRGNFEENDGGRATAAAGPASSTADSSASFVATSTTSPSPKAKPKSDTWCLPNAAMQNFSGVVLKEDDGLMPKGKWEGQHWWYHDEITSGFHMVVSIGGDTYGFWDLGILGAAGNTEYVAAYRGDECLFYQEEVQPGSSPFDEDVTCRGSAWAGNVSLVEEVEFGYGTNAERWGGTILDIEDDKAEYGGLPHGTESLVDLQRNPQNSEEVRLLYHRVVAPTQGVLGWAGGDSMSFDLVFTGVESMTASDVLELVKVPSICEVMAGEFHDQQARGGNTNGGLGGSGGGRALRSTTTSRTAIPPLEASRERIQAADGAAAEAGAVAEGLTGTIAPALRTPVAPGRGEGDKRKAGSGESGGEANSARVAESGVRISGGIGGARQLARSLGVEAMAEEEEGEEDEARAGGSRDEDDVVGDVGRGEPRSESAAAEVAVGLLPIHQVLKSLSPRGYRHRG